jgi:hypothetical protein
MGIENFDAKASTFPFKSFNLAWNVESFIVAWKSLRAVPGDDFLISRARLNPTTTDYVKFAVGTRRYSYLDE